MKERIRSIGLEVVGEVIRVRCLGLARRAVLLGDGPTRRELSNTVDDAGVGYGLGCDFDVGILA